MSARAFVCGCAGTSLDEGERRFIAEARPWGLILFRRNVADPAQVAALAASFRAIVGRDDAPVLVDQEGGRVQRLGPPHWPRQPAAARYGEIREPGRAADLARLGGELTGRDLRACGVTVDCAPVLDLAGDGTTAAIGDRAFGRDPGAVAALAGAWAEGLMAGGALPVVKHVPGHGRATVDSHHALPVVTADRAALERDMSPFRALNHLPMMMTAHVVFTALDPDRPVTTSKRAIDAAVRGAVGFDGLLLSDDLSMEALKGTLGERAAAAAAAGCDVLLHCNGAMAEARAVAEAAPPLDGRAAERAAAALARLAAPAPRDLGADRLAFAEAMGVAA